MYRLYVDEVGTDVLTNLQEDNHRYLSLTGIAMQVSDARDNLEPSLNAIKADLFNHDPDAPLIFHRKDIMGGKGAFGPIRTDENFRASFDERILDVYQNAPYKVITALIDKLWMARQDHWVQTHPYHYLMGILTEKYVQFLERRRAIGDIMPESRQNKDTLLQAAYDDVRANGLRYVERERISASLPGSKLKFRKKSDNIAGLQLSDMLAHPSHMFVREKMGHDVNRGPFCRQVCEILWNLKYDRSPYNGKIKGYGYKHLPDTQRAANAAPMD
jgi:Protein of unknown function (DUF3800)